MNSTSFWQALNLALELSAAERAALAHELLASLEGPADPDAAEAWEAEIGRRLEQLDCGGAQTVDAGEALARIESRLGRRCMAAVRAPEAAAAEHVARICEIWHNETEQAGRLAREQ